GGIHAVEHGREEGRPGALARAVGKDEAVEPVGKLQHRAVQAAEGGLHAQNHHGASLPSSAARRYLAAAAASGSPAAKAPWSCESAMPRRLPVPASSQSAWGGTVSSTRRSDPHRPWSAARI